MENIVCLRCTLCLSLSPIAENAGSYRSASFRAKNSATICTLQARVRVLLLPFSVPCSACALPRCQWRFIQPLRRPPSPAPIGRRNFENAKSNYGHPRPRSHILRKFINKHENAWNVHRDYVSRWKLFRRASRHNKAN